jgi:hypothetical protein
VRRLITAIAILVACGPTPPAQDPETPKTCLKSPTVECVHTSLEYFANATCQCSTKSCVEDIGKELQTWGADIAKVASKDLPSPDADPKSQELLQRYQKCVQRKLNEPKSSGW